MTWIIKPSKHGSTKHEKKRKEMNYNKLMFIKNDMVFLLLIGSHFLFVLGLMKIDHIKCV